MKEGGGIALISEEVVNTLGIPCAVLMGANIANEVASENYCEATIGMYFVICETCSNNNKCLKNVAVSSVGRASNL